MAKLAWIAVGATIIGLGAAGIACADEADDAVERDANESEEVRSIDDILEPTGYLNNRVEPIVLGYSLDSAAHLNLDINFEDNSAIGRLSRIRNLSFLTIAKQRKSRLFLGVNEDGLVGLHLTATSDGLAIDQTVELSRLPYLEKGAE